MSKTYKLNSPLREAFIELLQQGYSLIERHGRDIVIGTPEGTRELWGRNDGHASAGIRFEGHDYEFVTSCDNAIDEATR